MKKTFATYIAAALALSSCGDFLERSAQDLVIPNSVSQYKELLQGEGYFKNFNNKTKFINYMTDDIEYIDFDIDADPDGVLEEMNYVYTWQPEIENSAFTDEMYSWIYEQVLAANTVLDGLEDASGTDTERNELKGQALFQRAYANFLLVNTYGYLYTSDQADKKVAPLRLDPTPKTSPYPTNTSREIWDQVESDINEAVTLLANYHPSNKHEINGYAALLLAARVALYMEKYDKAEELATELLRQKSSLYDISGKGLVEPNMTGSADNDNFINIKSNPEIIWNFCDRSNTNLYNEYAFQLAWGTDEGLRISLQDKFNNNASNTLMGCYTAQVDKSAYDKADKRKCFFFQVSMYDSYFYEESCYYGQDAYASMYDEMMPAMQRVAQIFKYDRKDAYQGNEQQAFRTAEAYLILAEAYARQASPSTDKALSYLNTLRRNRIADYTDLTMADFGSTDKLVDFIWDERRRELCFDECHRWWDLRRMGQPEIKHAWKGNETYTLKKGDSAYTLAAPAEERKFDTTLANPRPARSADNK